MVVQIEQIRSSHRKLKRLSVPLLDAPPLLPPTTAAEGAAGPEQHEEEGRGGGHGDMEDEVEVARRELQEKLRAEVGGQWAGRQAGQRRRRLMAYLSVCPVLVAGWLAGCRTC